MAPIQAFVGCRTFHSGLWSEIRANGGECQANETRSGVSTLSLTDPSSWLPRCLLSRFRQSSRRRLEGGRSRADSCNHKACTNHEDESREGAGGCKAWRETISTLVQMDSLTEMSIRGTPT